MSISESDIEYLRGRIDSLQLLLSVILPGLVDDPRTLYTVKHVMLQIRSAEGVFEDMGKEYRDGAEDTLQRFQAVLDRVREEKSQPVS